MEVVNRKHPTQPILSFQSASGPWPIHLPLPSNTKDADDEALLLLVKEGSTADSQSALETIFLRHHQDVWRYVKSRVSSAADADEISAAVWLVVIEKIYDFVWTGVPIKSWLLSIAHRKVLEFFNNPLFVSLDHLKETRNEVLHFIASQLHLFDEYDTVTQVSPKVRSDADELLHKLISRLSDTERKIIMLIYFEELENATEVANRLGMNKSTIRVYHKRARDKLRKSPELCSLFDVEA